MYNVILKAFSEKAALFAKMPAKRMSALAANCLAINLKKCVEILSHTSSAAGSNQKID
jgi:hypothetical protein